MINTHKVDQQTIHFLPSHFDMMYVKYEISFGTALVNILSYMFIQGNFLHFKKMF